MDLETILAEVQSWPVEDRLHLMERIRDGLVEQGLGLGLTEELKVEIARRLTEDDVEPDGVFFWEEVQAEAFRQLGR